MENLLSLKSMVLGYSFIYTIFRGAASLDIIHLYTWIWKTQSNNLYIGKDVLYFITDKCKKKCQQITLFLMNNKTTQNSIPFHHTYYWNYLIVTVIYLPLWPWGLQLWWLWLPLLIIYLNPLIPLPMHYILKIQCLFLYKNKSRFITYSTVSSSKTPETIR